MPVPGCNGREQGYSLDRSPIHRRAITIGIILENISALFPLTFWSDEVMSNCPTVQNSLQAHILGGTMTYSTVKCSSFQRQCSLSHGYFSDSAQRCGGCALWWASVSTSEGRAEDPKACRLSPGMAGFSPPGAETSAFCKAPISIRTWCRFTPPPRPPKLWN